jgi:hypothetical protein
MNTLTDLLAADHMKLWFSGDYQSEPKVIDPGSFKSEAICIPKVRGDLEVALTGKEFGFPAFDVDLSLHGTSIGQDTQGHPLVLWKIDQVVDRYLDQIDATVDRIEGELTTALKAITDESAQKDTSCGSAYHRFVVALDPVAAKNQLTISLRKDIGGVSHEGHINVSNLQFLGQAARNLSDISVHIHLIITDECGIGVVQGGKARFWASIRNVPEGLTETYRWEVSGAQASRSTTERGLEVNVPSTATEFTVSLTVIAGDYSAGERRIVRPAPPYIASIVRLVCEITMKYGAPWIWIIIIGGLMVTPGAIECIVCGSALTRVIGVISITLGIAGLVFNRRRLKSKGEVLDLTKL